MLLKVAVKLPVMALAFNVFTEAGTEPSVKLAAPLALTVVCEVASVIVLAEVVDTTFRVSIPVEVNEPPVWLFKVKVAASAEPAITVEL